MVSFKSVARRIISIINKIYLFTTTHNTWQRASKSKVQFISVVFILGTYLLNGCVRITRICIIFDCILSSWDETGTEETETTHVLLLMICLFVSSPIIILIIVVVVLILLPCGEPSLLYPILCYPISALYGIVCHVISVNLSKGGYNYLTCTVHRSSYHRMRSERVI